LLIIRSSCRNIHHCTAIARILIRLKRIAKQLYGLNHIVIITTVTHPPNPELVQFEYNSIEDALPNVKERLEAFEATAPTGTQIKIICLLPYMIVSKET
jgi:hypothetical protein